MRLKLRNRFAEYLLDAIADPSAEAPLRALVAFARSADAAGVAHDAAARPLARETALFEPCGDGVRLQPGLLSDLSALRDRAERAAIAVERCRSACGAASFERRGKRAAAGGPAPTPAELDWALCSAAVLFDLGLHFEVHEILEADWMRAAGALRTFLQGVIQVAVGLHHLANANFRGAASLLAEGAARLRPFRPSAWGTELSRFCADAERLAEAVARDPAAARSLPRPRLDVRGQSSRSTR